MCEKNTYIAENQRDSTLYICNELFELFAIMN